MVKEKRILSYFLGWLLVGYIILFIGINNVFAATYDTFDVTWYYRETSNENNLLNVVKNQDTPFYKATDEYLNGFTTRIEHAFVKEFQYVINYRLQMYYDISQDSYFRSDTIDRIIKYSWVDSDFKLLNTLVNQSEYTCQSSGICIRTFNISQQVLTLNNTTAIRFGVKTDNNISIGFYNSTQQVNYLLLDNISIEDNSNSTIIDQNNQIIAGQDGINNNITNSTNTITSTITDTQNNINSNIQSSQDNINQNINDMQQSIVDSNKETQDVIKDQFNSCRDSYNLLPNIPNTTREFRGVTVKSIDNEISVIGTATGSGGRLNGILYFNLNAGNYKLILTNSINSLLFLSISNDSSVLASSNGNSVEFSLLEETQIILGVNVIEGTTYNDKFKVMIVKSNENPTSYEPYGEQICTNKIDDTNDKLNGIQGALTDSSAPNTSNLENSAGWLPAGPLDSILNLPLTMLNSLTNSLGKTCTPLNLTLPYVNKNLQIPCLSSIFAQITGVNGLWSWVGTIASVLILYNYLLNLYSWVDRVLTLRAEFDEAMGADMANWGRL